MIRFVNPLLARETSQLCSKGIKARPDVFWDLNITFKYFVCLKKNQSIATYFLSTWNYFGQKWISKVYLEITHLEITLLMSNLLKHAKYLNRGY